MTSRLDRLFVLLESGSSNVTRKAAAKQLGEVQKLHPHELQNLLARIKTYLYSPTWDTRIAAGQAIQAVIENVPLWNPTPVPLVSSENTPEEKSNRKLNLELFDINNILKNGIHLTGSEGKEYDLQDESGSCSVSKQRQILNAMIGLDVTQHLGIEMNDLLSPEDLVATSTEKAKTTSAKAIGDLVQLEISQVDGLSIRERNRAQRKARQMVSKQRSVEIEDEEPKRKKSKVETLVVESSDNVPDLTGSWGNAVHWPFQSICDQFVADLFNPRWETRHGAAIGLREIISCHGKGAGKTANTSDEQMNKDNKLWLQDLAFRVLCVLSLDRFGDFVSDQVVAPVREACAQVLGTILNLMEKSNVESVLKIVAQMMTQNEWEARHGGLLALKYMLAVRKDLVNDLLLVALPLVIERLSDDVDDVSAVAAASLIPVAEEIVAVTPNQVADIISKLWDLLLDQDDLAAACNNFMGLLAALLSLPDTKKYIISQPITELIHRLWPFLSHNATSVRKSTLQTLKTLTHFPKGEYADWDVELLKTAMRHIFQRVLIEPNEEIQGLASQVWNNLIHNSSLNTLLLAACPCFGSWLCLTMQNAKSAFDPNLLIYENVSRSTRKNGKAIGEANSIQGDQKIFLGGSEATNIDVRNINATRARCLASKMLGQLSYYIVKLPPEFQANAQEGETPIQCYVKVLLSHLNTKSAIQRLVCGLVLIEWAKLQREPNAPQDLILRLHECLNENIYFDEIGFTFTRLIQETKDYVFTLKYYQVEVDESFMAPVLSLDQILQLTKSQTSGKVSKKVFETLEERRKNIFAAATQLLSDQSVLNITCQAALGGAVAELKAVSGKLNPIIKPLMESIKKEESEILQKISAEQIAHLIELFVNRTPCPNSKIISNLCTFLCSDTEFTPRVNKSSQKEETCSNLTEKGDICCILTLVNQQRLAEKSTLKRQNTTGTRGPGRPPAYLVEGCSVENVATVEEDRKVFQIQRRGAKFALASIARRFGEELPTKLPNLWSILCCESSVTTTPDDLIICLQVLELTCSSVHPNLLPQPAIRHMSARCTASLSLLDTEYVMQIIVNTIVPLLAVTDCDVKRKGAAEAIFCVVDRLQMKIIPYVVLLVIPLLGRMSDQNSAVRTICTQSFATLVQLLPLDSPMLDTENLCSEKEKERSFLRYLLNPKTIPDYEVPVPIKADLRSYQQAGVNWLAFLNKYKLHGILCDDMGLGKTLQSICILAGDHYNRQQEYLEKGSPDCKPLPSIVICPPTLTGHWVYEVEKFLSKEYLNPLQYSGPPAEREKLRSKVGEHNLIVASYDIVRNDIEFFRKIKWNYCILDEGHIIKNGKTKASKAIKSLVANHRLILSGTPIQNNVLELWSLFDFLMPGLLSTEKQFNAKYSRPILASWDPKSSPKEQEAGERKVHFNSHILGVIAMESLHRQILPFLLRRMKEDVLKDLPPKITQDYICELSQLQEQLYEDFSRSQAHQSLQDSLSKPSHTNTHIFQALRYLQNVCNHPKLVLTPQHPEYEKVMAQLAQQGTSMDDIQHSCKLPALKQLLLDCGIGTPVSNDVVYINQHRALIFCQLKSMLDIIETDLLKKHLPNVSYLRLDGGVPPSQRHGVVNKFNSDPSIDVLLLTTQVGGLGLNLTGADTVIFVEHDWNPMKDLQAMDRAHRIGQKKVVNVYRLITRGTLEEKIMGLQKFKLLTANTIISDENGAMETMETDQLFDLFTLKDGDSKSGTSKNSANTGASIKVPGLPIKSLLENLPELWEQQQYEKEFDLGNFIANLNK
ncbi:hypothetical protein RUM43_004325 [Polyplax serrata]|uniref:TATA-binding protein-associated factor 172 n=1 Tax=Polyplax serrata TaxID=468196 RepID=A0AAN8SAS3_POLSC